MAATFTPVVTLDDLESLLITPDVSIILFNHSPYCGISRRAYYEMNQIDHPIALIDVSRHHEVKHAIVDRTGVRHESPQVIIVRDGQVVWSASHGRITRHAVEQALETHDLIDLTHEQDIELKSR
jgi:bacillithiol system protein YtxJ